MSILSWLKDHIWHNGGVNGNIVAPEIPKHKRNDSEKRDK